MIIWTFIDIFGKHKIDLTDTMKSGNFIWTFIDIFGKHEIDLTDAEISGNLITGKCFSVFKQNMISYVSSPESCWNV